MSTVDEDAYVQLFAREIHNPQGLRLDRGIPTPGEDWGVWVDDCPDGTREFTLNDSPMTVDVARALAAALLEAADVFEANR